MYDTIQNQILKLIAEKADRMASAPSLIKRDNLAKDIVALAKQLDQDLASQDRADRGFIQSTMQGY